MRILLILGLICFAATSFGQIHSVDSIRTMLRDRNIRTMEEFLENLPEDIRSNYTLMHTSKSLHGSSYEEPRAMMYGNGQWIVTFNGSPSQAAGNMVEMMIYNPSDKTYAFHELDFSGTTPVLKENPAKCLACHGSNPRPIWDHYNAWPGAYGDVDDRFNEAEYKHLQSFIQSAATHPRYKHLKNLSGTYKLAGPHIKDGLTERSMVNHNRDLNLVLHQQKVKDLSAQMVAHPKFQKVKGLLFYFLSKCYLKPGTTYQGDGPILDAPVPAVASLLKSLKEGKSPDLTAPFQPEQFLDYVFSRLEVDTNNWYMNSRDLATYKVLRDGSDRLHEAWMNYLLELNPEYKDLYNVRPIDYQVMVIKLAELKDKANACREFAQMSPEGIGSLGQPLPEVNTPQQTMRGERVCRGIPLKCETIYRSLPQICMKCHAQQSGSGKIYLPFHEFPERIQNGQTELPQRMLEYITSGRMPMRTGGDAAAFEQYKNNDYPKLKKYLEDLLK